MCVCYDKLRNGTIMMKSINPTTGTIIRVWEPHSRREMGDRIAAAAEAQFDWRRKDVADRVELLRRASICLREQKTHHVELMIQEMGKPRTQAEAEIEKCASTFEYYAERAQEGLRPVPGLTSFESWVCYEPLGVVLAIMPWNFPYWQFVRCAAPALAAGNAVLMKHAENVQGCAQAIEHMFVAAGFPVGLVSNARVPVEWVSELIADARVAAVTLTGSTQAGAAVAAEAGQHIKPCVLELGGSDAYVVLDDADLDRAVEACARSRLQNNGQSCIAAKRLVVVESIRAEFEARLVRCFEAKVVGDPNDSDTQLGPLAREDLRTAIMRQVGESLHQGARCLLGGAVPQRTGWFYPATVLTDVSPGMPAFEEELFGPVASVLSAKDEAEAIQIANNSTFGLGGAVFSQNIERARKVASALAAGTVAINDFVRSDARLPFGGIKRSGFGRELGIHGLHAFVNIKTLTVA